MANTDTIAQELAAHLKTIAAEIGTELGASLAELRVYIAQRLAHLNLIKLEPGFREAVIAERDSIALVAAGRAVDAADATDARIIGAIDGAITIGLGAIA